MVRPEVSVRDEAFGIECDRSSVPTSTFATATMNACDVASSAYASSARIAQVCESYAARRRYQCVTLRDLSHAAAVSERRVRQAFYDCYGTSPTAYLRAAALDQVRRALLANSAVRDPVTRAASDFGFRHLSRFASQYRTLFGESPSETLGRTAGDRSRPKAQSRSAVRFALTDTG